MQSTTGENRPRCLRCFRAAVTCICADLPVVDNRTGIVILQHPRERFHPVGTEPFARLGLRNCRVEVAVGDAERRVARRIDLPEGTALLYPRDGARELSALPAAERPSNLLVLDGTWPQARRLYLDNPWLRELPHVRFTPTQESGYLVRREPRPDYLSTIESIVTALRILEPETEGLDSMLVAFARMNERQVAYMRSTTAKPRHQRPRQRESRRLPAELSDPGLLVVYGELVPLMGSTTKDPRRQLLQWVAAQVDGDRRFEAVIRPTGAVPTAGDLVHVGIAAEAVASGQAIDEVRSRFAEFARGDAVLAAWNQRTLDLARHHLGHRGSTVLLKAAYTNLRGGRHGALEDVVAREALEHPPLPFAGRAAVRTAEALAIARWLRARATAPGSEGTPD